MKSLAIALLLLVVSAGSVAQDTTYQNPVDGKANAAPNGWASYGSENQAAQNKEKVRILNVQLLQDQDEMASRSTPEELARFINAANGIAVEVFSSYDRQATLQAQFTCRPDKCETKIASSGAPPNELLQAYLDKLVKLPPPKVSGEVRFQVMTGVNT